MSKSNDFENDLLLNIFNNIAIATIGDATGLRGSTAAGSLYLAFHTADPGEAGKQNTSEANYPGYARAAVVRSAAGFTVAGNTVTLTTNVDFAESTGAGTNVLNYWSVGYGASGATKMLYSGALTAPTSITVNQGVIPRLKAATNIVED